MKLRSLWGVRRRGGDHRLATQEKESQLGVVVPRDRMPFGSSWQESGASAGRAGVCLDGGSVCFPIDFCGEPVIPLGGVQR